MLEDLGWDAAWSASLAAASPGAPAARVLAVHRAGFVVQGAGEPCLATLSGRLRHRARSRSDLPVVGDWVTLAAGDVVDSVLPRRTVLRRAEAAGPEALVANADVAFVALGLDHPLDERRLERLAGLAREGGADVVVALTKGDRARDPVAAVEAAQALTGAPAVALSARDGWGVAAIRARLVAGRTGVLLGPSGAGKSTLVNALLGEERQRTLAVRERDGAGRHATTHRELFVLPGGGLLVDTPGVREPRMESTGGLETTFADVDELARGCRFADCRHEGEPDCAVRAAIDAGELDPARLAALRLLEREALTAEERRSRAREVHREPNRIVRER